MTLPPAWIKQTREERWRDTKRLKIAERALAGALQYCENHPNKLMFGQGPDIMGFENDIRIIRDRLEREIK